MEITMTKINRSWSMEYNEPKIISEIGCNHMGQFEIAKELIKLSKDCGANYAKFQKRTPRELLTPEQYDAPHPIPYNAYGESYGAHREFLEFTIEQHVELKKFAESIGIGYTTSVWDITSALEIVKLEPDFIKVPSACNNHWEMLSVLRDEYEGDVHISTGMTTREEVVEVINFFQKGNQGSKRLVLYSCTSGYPVPFKDVCLLEISRLQEEYEGQIKAVGFSGHHLGIGIDIAAFTLGASWIERHFTKDRTWKGTDHAASLEPAGLSKLVRNLHQTYEALSYKNEDILPIEVDQREKLKYRHR